MTQRYMNYLRSLTYRPEVLKPIQKLGLSSVLRRGVKKILRHSR